LSFGLSDEDGMSLLHSELGRPWPWLSFGSLGIEDIKTSRAILVSCLVLVSGSAFCGCATTRQSSATYSSDSAVRQEQPNIWQEWGYGFLYAISLGAYQSAEQDQREQHP
jgi:hypothetical protein